MIIWGAVNADGSGDNCEGCEVVVIGALGLVGLRIWEVVDSITGPSNRNNRVRNARMRAGYPQPYYGKVVPYIAPSREAGGGTAGLTLRF